MHRYVLFSSEESNPSMSEYFNPDAEIFITVHLHYIILHSHHYPQTFRLSPIFLCLLSPPFFSLSSKDEKPQRAPNSPPAPNPFYSAPSPTSPASTCPPAPKLLFSAKPKSPTACSACRPTMTAGKQTPPPSTSRWS